VFRLFDQFGLASRYTGFPKPLEDETRAAVDKAIDLLRKCESCLCDKEGVYADYCLAKNRKKIR